MIREGITQGIQQGWIVSALVEQPLQSVDGIVHAAGLLENDGALVLDRRMLGMPLQGMQQGWIVSALVEQPLQSVDGIVHAAGLLENDGALVLDRRMLGMPLQG